MAVIWERYSKTANHVSEGTSTSFELFHNEVDDHYFQNAPITIVDGIVTVITNTDNLVIVRLAIHHEFVVAADLGVLSPDPGDRTIYYEWFAARGPLVFRLRSKRTMQPQQKLWLTLGKPSGGGTDGTDIRVGLMLLLQRS